MLRFTPSSAAFRMLRLAARRAFGRTARPAPRSRTYPTLHTLEGREAPGETFAAIWADADFLGLGGALLDIDPLPGAETAVTPPAVAPTDLSIPEPASPAGDLSTVVRSATESTAADGDTIAARLADLPEPGESLTAVDFSLADDSFPPATAGGDSGAGSGGSGGAPTAGGDETSQSASGPRSDEPATTAGTVADNFQLTASPAAPPARAASTTNSPSAPAASTGAAAKTPRVWVEAVDGPTGHGFRIWRDGSGGNLPVGYRLTSGPAGASTVNQVVITDGNRSAAVVVPGGANARLTVLPNSGYVIAAPKAASLKRQAAVTPDSAAVVIHHPSPSDSLLPAPEIAGGTAAVPLPKMLAA